MRGWMGLSVVALWLVGAGAAYAQPAPAPAEKPAAEKPAAEEATAEKPADEAPDAEPSGEEPASEDAAASEEPEQGAEEEVPAEEEPLPEDEPPPPPEEEEEDPFARDERRRVAHQAAIEQAEPRPPEVEEEELEEKPKSRTIEIGFDIAYVLRPFDDAVFETDVSYSNTVAWGLHAHWSVLEWLRVTPYFLDVHHGLDIPQGALVAPAANSISPEATVSETTATTFVFGAKVQPTLNFTPRLRAWLTAGIGWGRFTFPEMTFTENEQEFVVRQRNSVFVEFPLGLGVSYDIIEDWLALEFESTAAPWAGQSGTAQETFQALDAEGNIRNIGPFGAAEASFVQALGLSLIL